jgi:hypothetical protein
MNTTPRLKTDQADRTEYLTIDEARALPGLLGRIAGAMLAAHGEYRYTNTETGELVALVRKS